VVKSKNSIVVVVVPPMLVVVVVASGHWQPASQATSAPLGEFGSGQVSEPTGSHSSPGSTVPLPQEGAVAVVVVVVGASLVVVVGASVVVVVVVGSPVVVVGASVVVVVVGASGHWQPASQATNAPLGEFGSGQVSEPTGSHSSPGSTVPLPQAGAVVVVVLVVIVVVGSAVVDVVMVVVVVVVVSQSPGWQVPGPRSIPPASVHSCGVSSWHMSSMPGDVPVQQRTVAGAQPVAVQASQQDAKLLTQAEPPLGALHFAALFLTEQRVRPRRSVRQHVTNSASRPQVDFAEQFLASRTHS
jgi:hypothetical protein